MKRFILILALMAALFVSCCPNSCRAQAAQPETITVNVSDLTPDQLARIQAEKTAAELQAKVDTYGKWVGVGGEVGQAVRDGLMAVVDVADKFSNTNVGKFTMYLIAWKVIGKDVVRILLGIVIGFVATILIFRSYRQYCTHRVRTGNGAWYQFWVTKEYKTVEPDDSWDGFEFAKWSHIPVLLAAYGGCFAIMFT